VYIRQENKMIYQAYQTFTEFNRTDVAGLFLYPASVVNIFIPMVLFTLYIIVLLATYFSSKRLTGRGDFFASLAVAGYFTTIIAFVMSLVSGLVNITTLVVCIIAAIVGTTLLLISKR